MMDTQGNPERIFQIFQSKKITLIGIAHITVGYADLKLDLTKGWLQYGTKSDLCKNG